MKAPDDSTGTVRRVFLPIIVLALSIGIASLMVALKPEQEKKEHQANYPRVEVFTVHTEPVSIIVSTQGNVIPRQETNLTARISGFIEWVSPNFYEGGSFTEGEVLLRLDPLPYQSALAEARSRMALVRSTLLQEEEAAAQARRDWEAVGVGPPSDLVLRKPQLEKARADLEASRVAVKVAEDNLAYTEVSAPYDGRVRTKHVDVGQAITAQATLLASIFSVEAMEVPLAISLDDLAFVQADGLNNGISSDKIRVTLSCELAGHTNTWEAWLDRTAAALDERTRMINAFARMEPPFLSDRGNRLLPGMFVQAAIEGRTIENAAKVPREAIQPGGIAYRLDAENKLHSVPLEVLRADASWAVIENGLEPGDRLCLTPLLIYVEGMQVNPVAEAERTQPGNTESES